MLATAKVLQKYNAALTGAVMVATVLRVFAKKVTALRSPS